MKVRRGSLLAICAASAIVISGAGAHAAVADKKKPKKPAVVMLATATTWLAVGPATGLQGPPPQQLTDPTSPLVQQIAPLTQGLAFKGLGNQGFTRIAADPTDPSRLPGNYVLRAVVFGTAADAQKFRAADIKQVTDAGALKQVGTYRDGVVLDDSKGHINVMYTINNVALDVRGTVTETSPGTGATDLKDVAAAVLANSKKKA